MAGDDNGVPYEDADDTQTNEELRRALHELTHEMSGMQQQLHEMRDRIDQTNVLGEISTGLGSLVGVLEPLQNLVVSVEGPLPPAVGVALTECRGALGIRPQRFALPDRLPIVDQPVPFIAQPRDPAPTPPTTIGGISRGGTP